MRELRRSCDVAHSSAQGSTIFPLEKFDDIRHIDRYLLSYR